MSIRFRPGRLLGSGTRRIVVVVFAIAGVAFFFYPRHAQSLLHTVGNPLADLAALPMARLATLDRGIRDWWGRYVALQDVSEQNRELRRTVRRLEGDLNQWRERVLASERLSALLAFQKQAPMQTVAAKVIGRSTSNWYQGVVLNKGEDDGVHVEMGVTTPAGVVGTIVKTGGSTSIALLILDPNIAVTGLIQRTRDEGIVQGTSQGLVRIKYLPPLSSVEHGDVVVTSGLTGGFPRGLLIGRVSRVKKSDGDLFQIADVVPVVNFRQMEDVLVVTAPRPPEAMMALEQAMGVPARPHPAP